MPIPPTKKRVLVLMMTLAILVALLLCTFWQRDSSLSHWQRQATKVHLGMTRSEVEALLPPQVVDNSLFWRIEDWRMRHAAFLPKVKTMRKFRLVHSDSNWEEYEIVEGIYICVRYDMAGSPPPPYPPGQGVWFPGDRVITLPTVSTIWVDNPPN